MTVVINGTTGISPVTAAGTSALVDGMTVGRGAGEVATNTAVGASALAANTNGSNNTVVGYQAGYTNTTGINRTSVGSLAGYSGTAATSSTCIGYYAGYSTTGTDNTLIGAGAGYQITTGTKNTVLGEYTGYQGGLDIRTSNNIVVLSDGDGQLLFLGYGTATNGRYIINDGGYFYCASDNVMGLGASSKRWTTVYATTGTINTSDVNQKQDIAALDDAEKRVAIAIKSLIKKYRFKDAVAEKGDTARIHVGAVAQEVQAAFVAEGLDPTRYALFCSDTWYEVDGQPSQKASEPFTAETPNAVEVTRLGLRYDELLAFVIAAL